eukprot:XP_001695824.1 predicted protein [Chlamydomonas reinhardtii]
MRDAHAAPAGAAGVAMVGVVWLVDAAIRYSDSGFGGRGEERSPGAVAFGSPCYTLLYSPAGDPWVEALVAGVMAANSPPIPPGQVAGFANASQELAMVIQTNASGVFFKGKFQDPNTYIALPLQVEERESGTRGALTAMGLRDSAHWVSWVVPELALTAAHAGAMLAALHVMRFALATRNSAALIFLLLWGSELALCSVALLLSALLRRSSSAVPAGFAAYVVCWALQLVVQFGFPYKPSVAPVWVGIFSCLPPCVLTKGLHDLATATLGDGTGGISWANRNSYCLVDAPPPAATAATANAPAANAAPAYWQSDCVLPLGQCIWALGFTAIAVYLDQEGLSGQPPWAPLLRLLRGGAGLAAAAVAHLARPLRRYCQWAAGALPGVPRRPSPHRHRHTNRLMHKPRNVPDTYNHMGSHFCRAAQAAAVQALCRRYVAEVEEWQQLSATEGELVGWEEVGAIAGEVGHWEGQQQGVGEKLAAVAAGGNRGGGPNGAGKTTTIKCLIGFDVLWGCLTGREHLQVMADEPRVGAHLRLQGRLRCLGPSLTLRRRYGGGYRVSVGLKQLQGQQGQQGPPTSPTPSQQLDGAYEEVPKGCESRLPHLFRALEADAAALGVVDLQVKLSTLEDVYLEVIRQSNAAN